jgi:serine/threonine-protein kinase HipA
MLKCLHCYKPIKSTKDYHSKCALSFFGNTTAPILPYNLQDMAKLAKEIIERSITIPGVQPKLSLTTTIIDVMEKSKSNRLTVVGMLGGGYILKPPNQNYEQMTTNESLTMHLANTVGINTVPHSLMKLQSGELCYITKRIDRGIDGKKIHMLDMFQITEAFDKYRSSYEKIGKAVMQYCSFTVLETLKLWDLCVFCFITSNNDMHLKNFSLIKIKDEWQLSPAYDLLNVQLANPKDKEELALTLKGKKKRIKLNDFMDWGASMGLTKRQMENSLKIYKSEMLNMKIIIENSFLTESYKIKYLEILEEKYSILGL